MSNIEKLEKDGTISAEHRYLVNDLNKIKQAPGVAKSERAYRDKALQNLSSESGVFNGNPEDIEREIARIKKREAETN